MKVYVATKFERKHLARMTMRALESDGHEITYDWTSHDKSTDFDECRRQAFNDMKGVWDAHAIIVRPNTGREVGAWFEAGFLLGANVACGTRGIVIIVSRTPCMVFESLGRVYRVNTLSDARALLRVIEARHADGDPLPKPSAMN
jgi:hypothetical protein